MRDRGLKIVVVAGLCATGLMLGACKPPVNASKTPEKPAVETPKDYSKEVAQAYKKVLEHPADYFKKIFSEDEIKEQGLRLEHFKYALVNMGDTPYPQLLLRLEDYHPHFEGAVLVYPITFDPKNNDVLTFGDSAPGDGVGRRTSSELYASAIGDGLLSFGNYLGETTTIYRIALVDGEFKPTILYETLTSADDPNRDSYMTDREAQFPFLMKEAQKITYYDLDNFTPLEELEQGNWKTTATHSKQDVDKWIKELDMVRLEGTVYEITPETIKEHPELAEFDYLLPEQESDPTHCVMVFDKPVTIKQATEPELKEGFKKAKLGQTTDVLRQYINKHASLMTPQKNIMYGSDALENKTLLAIGAVPIPE